MKICGIDPSVNSTGIWVSPPETGFVMKGLSSKHSEQDRLQHYYRELVKLFTEYQIELVVKEGIFLHPRRFQGALLMVQLHGVIYSAAAAVGGIDVVSVAPTQLKQFATGSGRASKEDMELHALHQNYSGPKQDDVIDAWHLVQYGLANLSQI